LSDSTFSLSNDLEWDLRLIIVGVQQVRRSCACIVASVSLVSHEKEDEVCGRGADARRNQHSIAGWWFVLQTSFTICILARLDAPDCMAGYLM